MSQIKKEPITVRFFIGQLPGATVCKCGACDLNKQCPVYINKHKLSGPYVFSEYDNAVTGEISVTLSLDTPRRIVPRDAMPLLHQTARKIREFKNKCPYNIAQRTK